MKAVAKTLKGRAGMPVSRLPVHRPGRWAFLFYSCGPLSSPSFILHRVFALEPARWIGLENYQDIAHDRLFFNSLKVTFLYVIASVPLKLLVALAVAR